MLSVEILASSDLRLPPAAAVGVDIVIWFFLTIGVCVNGFNMLCYWLGFRRFCDVELTALVVETSVLGAVCLFWVLSG